MELPSVHPQERAGCSPGSHLLVPRLLHPLVLLRGRQDRQAAPLGSPTPELECEEREKEGDLLCRVCKNTVTSRAQAIEQRGSHQHTFFNPEGIVFDIGCFATAKGCLHLGEPTSRFTWFAGCTWRFALCSLCQIHLGWYYQAQDGSSFYGLIVKMLEEGH